LLGNFHNACVEWIDNDAGSDHARTWIGFDRGINQGIEMLVKIVKFLGRATPRVSVLVHAFDFAEVRESREEIPEKT